MKIDELPDCWQTALAEEISAEWFHQLHAFVSEERKNGQVFPPDHDVFNALKLVPLNRVRVVILGQDPYHDDGQAHGLSFSVKPGVKPPPSLRNIFKELHTDLGIEPAGHGCLESWARQGVLLLNTVLTVRAHQANSHRKQGWEEFTHQIIAQVNELPAVVFVLWGKPAQKKADLIGDRHLVIQSAHPSPLSARRGFFGSRPFSKINAFLEEHGLPPIDWRLPETME